MAAQLDLLCSDTLGHMVHRCKCYVMSMLFAYLMRRSVLSKASGLSTKSVLTCACAVFETKWTYRCISSD
jgi:hypothetical protein